ncbi:MAG: hypothetical protein IPM35_16445 [Myxococcales bacterium]|nr:hypothetical protein [Myxococcales bacterium]
MQAQDVVEVVAAVAPEQGQRDGHRRAEALAPAQNRPVDQAARFEPLVGRALAAEIVLLVGVGAVRKGQVVHAPSEHRIADLREAALEVGQVRGVNAARVQVEGDGLLEIRHEGPRVLDAVAEVPVEIDPRAGEATLAVEAHAGDHLPAEGAEGPAATGRGMVEAARGAQGNARRSVAGAGQGSVEAAVRVAHALGQGRVPAEAVRPSVGSMTCEEAVHIGGVVGDHEVVAVERRKVLSNAGGGGQRRAEQPLDEAPRLGRALGEIAPRIGGSDLGAVEDIDDGFVVAHRFSSRSQAATEGVTGA